MSKHSWETVLAKCKELDLKPESVLKVVQRMSGKDRAETPREILRASWVNDVAYHVYHRIGTNHDKKIPTKKLIRNYVKTEHYQECYRTFFLKEWDQLPSIRKSKFTNEIDKTRALVESHTSNCQKLLLSKAGKKQLAFLVMSGGNMLEVPGTKIEYLRNLRKGLKKITKPKTKTFLEQVGFRIDKSGNIIKI